MINAAQQKLACSGATFLLCTTLACAFDSSGMGGDASAGSTQGATTEPVEPDTTAGPSSSTTSTSGATGSSDDSEPVADPLIEVSPIDGHDFGFVLLGEQEMRMVELTNVGTAVASNIGIQLSAPFDGSSRCPEQLAPTESCKIEVRFEPTVPRQHEVTLVVAHEGPDGPAQATYPLQGAGFSRNLLENGDGSAGNQGDGSPPTGWTASDALSRWSANDCSRAGGPKSGDTCLGWAVMQGAHPLGTHTAIHQFIELPPGWIDGLDAGATQLEICGHARIMELRANGTPDDRWRLVSTFEDGGHVPVGVALDSSWQPPCEVCTDPPEWEAIEALEQLPAGTRNVRVELMCETVIDGVGACDAFFDELSVRALPTTWPTQPCAEP